MPVPRALLALALVLTAAAPSSAHDPGLSSIDVRISERNVFAVLSLAGADAKAIGGSNDTIAAMALASIDVRIDERRLQGTLTGVTVDRVTGVQVRVVYDRIPGSRLLIRSAIPGQLARGHHEFVSIRSDGGEALADGMLDAASNEVTADIESASHCRGTVGQFFVLGIHHILTGYDHLLFLAGALVVLRSWRHVVQTITAFTVAHSITLAAAATGLIDLPGSVVEPVIAASIVYVGLENLLRLVGPSRWKITFGFGLIHGLGFAAALRELGIGTHGLMLLVPLASFNAGVEAGQLAAAAVLVPLFWALRAQNETRFQFATIWSLLVVAAGGYWVLERIV